jgi:hypothetical protein
MKSKLILILILIILYVSIYNDTIHYTNDNLTGSSYEKFSGSSKFDLDIQNMDSDKLNKLLSFIHCLSKS